MVFESLDFWFFLPSFWCAWSVRPFLRAWKHLFCHCQVLANKPFPCLNGKKRGNACRTIIKKLTKRTKVGLSDKLEYHNSSRSRWCLPSIIKKWRNGVFASVASLFPLPSYVGRSFSWSVSVCPHNFLKWAGSKTSLLLSKHLFIWASIEKK